MAREGYTVRVMGDGHRCKPPGRWGRFWANLSTGAVIACNTCGQVWRLMHDFSDDYWQRMDS